MDESIRKRIVPLKENKPRPASFQHFKTEQEWEDHRRQVEQAQKDGAPF